MSIPRYSKTGAFPDSLHRELWRIETELCIYGRPVRPMTALGAMCWSYIEPGVLAHEARMREASLRYGKATWYQV